MTENEIILFEHLLNTLNGVVVSHYRVYNAKGDNKGRYDHSQIGKMVFIKRVLAELVGANINEFLFPGESVFVKEDGDEINDWLHFFGENQREKPLTVMNKKFLENEVLSALCDIRGSNDSDDACLRCARRMLAEVIGVPDLRQYRLMMEKEVKPLYFKDYSPKDLLEI